VSGVRSQAARSQATASSKVSASAPVRTAPGATKTAVLGALASGSAMTAGEVATATGLGRASVSTTLSKLAKAGAVTKAARGYELSGQNTSG
jgi:DNA-binding transcriptional ArsR family regulator